MPRRWTGALVALVTAGSVLVLAPGPAAAENTHDSCTENSAYIPEEPWVLDALAFDEAHRTATGQGILVAVVDSGVDATNPHLVGVVEPGIDLVGDGESTDGTRDVEGHGTAIAGVIVAQAVEGSGIRGAAPGVRILPVRVFRSADDPSREAGWGPDLHRIAEGIRLAADRDAHIINVSLSDTDDDPALRRAVEYASERGSLVVASAGNRSTTEFTDDGLRYPAAYPEVLGVAATDTTLQPGADSIHGPQVDIAAPGMLVATVASDGYDCVFAAESAASSFATAYVSAAAALVAQAHPEGGPALWHERLRVSALRDRPDRRDDLVGWGVVRPFEALAVQIDSSVPGADAYEIPVAGSLPPAPPAPLDVDGRTVRLALGVGGGAAVVWALLWILFVARRPGGAS